MFGYYLQDDLHRYLHERFSSWGEFSLRACPDRRFPEFAPATSEASTNDVNMTFRTLYPAYMTR